MLLTKYIKASAAKIQKKLLKQLHGCLINKGDSKISPEFRRHNVSSKQRISISIT